MLVRALLAGISLAGLAASLHAADLETCTESLGTLAVVEDRNAAWYQTFRDHYKLQSTVPLIRMLVQKSNCFVVVERGAAMNNMMQERSLDRSGETRQGSDFGKGQIVAADYSMNPTISFSERDTGGLSGAVGALSHKLGSYGSAAGALVGHTKTREAATMLTLVDNRSGVQLAASEGNSSKTDFGAWGGVFGSGSGGAAAGGAGGYTNTPEGKVLASAFADAYNNLVKSVKNYKAQEVRGGLGKGGRLGVSGGRTPASKELGQEK
jgi:curli biogenesis system outer membrane secretion channel CsgG